MVHIVFISALICAMPQLNKKYPFRFFSFLILFLFMAVRYDYGNDYMAYLNIHELMNSGSRAWGENDFLFYRLNLLIPNFYMFIGVTSLFYIITIWYFIRINLPVKQYWFALLILLINPYIFLMHLSGLRQTFAICFFLIAVKYGIERKKIPYVIFILLASGMHSSAIVLLPVYFILNQTPFKKKYLIATIVLLLTLIFTPLVDIILMNILKYLPMYQHYYEQGTTNSLRSTIISSFYLLLVIFNLGKLKGKEIIYGKLSLIATIISILVFKVSMLSRIGMYFDVFLIITIPYIFNRIDNKYNKAILFTVLIVIYLLRYYSFFTNPLWESFREYKTIPRS